MDKPDRARRALMLSTAAMAAGGLAVEARSADDPVAGSSTPIDRLDLRSEFSFSEDFVPLNAANLCPMPTRVARVVENANRDIDRDPSGVNRAEYEGAIEVLRMRIAALLNAAHQDEIAIVRNATEANNIIVWGIPLDKGSQVLIWDENHPSNNVAWRVRAAREGFSVKSITLPPDVSSMDEAIDLFVSAVTEKTRVIAVSQVSNLSGTRLDVARLKKKLRRDDIFLLADGAQTFGAEPVDLKAMGCDAYTGSIHKWMMGPREVGLLHLKKPWIDKIWPTNVSLHWGDGVETSQIGARKFESFGQRDDAAIAGSAAALEFVKTVSPEAIEARIRRHRSRIRETVQDLDLSFVGLSERAFLSGVTVIAASHGDVKPLIDEFYHRHGLIVATKKGGIRISPHIFNTDDHIARFTAVLATMRKRL